jgi:hypothetical protein
VRALAPRVREFEAMPLFRRRSREVAAEAAPALVLGELPCSERGCLATTGIECAYVDRRGQACPTAWCPEHRDDVAGSTYCRRHAGVMRALVGDDALAPPDVGSRAASLAAWVAADLDAGVLELLQGVRGPEEELRITVARLIFIDHNRTRAWEHAWKLSRHTGIGHWVAVQVTEDQDDVVELIADGIHVYRGVPPWITARRVGHALGPDDDASARRQYYGELLAAIAEQLAQKARR